MILFTWPNTEAVIMKLLYQIIVSLGLGPARA